MSRKESETRVACASPHGLTVRYKRLNRKFSFFVKPHPPLTTVKNSEAHHICWQCTYTLDLHIQSLTHLFPPLPSLLKLLVYLSIWPWKDLKSWYFFHQTFWLVTVWKTQVLLQIRLIKVLFYWSVPKIKLLSCDSFDSVAMPHTKLWTFFGIYF